MPAQIVRPQDRAHFERGGHCPIERGVHAPVGAVAHEGDPTGNWPMKVASIGYGDLARQHPSDATAVSRKERTSPTFPVGKGRSLQCMSSARSPSSASVGGCRVNGFDGLTRGIVPLAQRAGSTGAGARQAPAAAIRWLWSFNRLWVAVIRRHSARHADLPRRRKRVMPRLNLICPNTGSTVAWRFR